MRPRAAPCANAARGLLPHSRPQSGMSGSPRKSLGARPKSRGETSFFSRRVGGMAVGRVRSRWRIAPRYGRDMSMRSRKLRGVRRATAPTPSHHPGVGWHRFVSSPCAALPWLAPRRPLHERCAPARFDGSSLPPCARGTTWWATNGSSGRGPSPQMAQRVALAAIWRSICWDARDRSRGGMACSGQREPWETGRPHWMQARIMLGALARW